MCLARTVAYHARDRNFNRPNPDRKPIKLPNNQPIPLMTLFNHNLGDFHVQIHELRWLDTVLKKNGNL